MSRVTEVCGHQPEHGMGRALHNTFPAEALKEDYSCQRPVWENTGKCVLHADGQEKPPKEIEKAMSDGGPLTDLNLQGCTIEDVSISKKPIVNADFRGAFLKDVSLYDCHLWEVDFTGAGMKEMDFESCQINFGKFRNSECRDVRFKQARVPDARFDNAHLRGAVFKGTNLESSTFDGTDIRGADFTGAALYQTSFRNSRINEKTDFGRRSWYESGGLIQHRLHRHKDPDEDPYERAAWQYRMLSRLYRENSEPQEARKYYIKEKNARRILYRRKRKILSYGKAELARWTTRYGESPWSVVGWSIAVIAISTYLYSITGGVQRAGEGFSSDPVSLVYFSIVTFTTLGYGDFQPASSMTRLVAGTEAFIGSLLMALLVFVLGRRVTW